jgi:hypothetical protein
MPCLYFAYIHILTQINLVYNLQPSSIEIHSNITFS